jgi:hypothetical protein
MYNTLEIISLSINVVLIVVSVGLAVASWRDYKKKNSQVKVWMEQANGVSQGLQRIIHDKWSGLYTSVNDITNAVYAVHASAFALYQSLYDERFLSEDEIKEHQKILRAKLDKEMGLDSGTATQEPSGKSPSTNSK